MAKNIEIYLDLQGRKSGVIATPISHKRLGTGTVPAIIAFL